MAPRGIHMLVREMNTTKAKGSAGMLQMWSDLQESQAGLGGMRYSKHGRLH